jgi:hypothetical protein
MDTFGWFRTLGAGIRVKLGLFRFRWICLGSKLYDLMDTFGEVI